MEEKKITRTVNGVEFTLDDVKDELPCDEVLTDAALLFKVFGDKTRTTIISILARIELCVEDIATMLDMTMSAVSHQLSILRHNKIVKYRRCGKTVYYSLDDEHIREIYKLAVEHVSE